MKKFLMFSALLVFAINLFAQVDLQQAEKDFATRGDDKQGSFSIGKSQKAFSEILKDPKSTVESRLHAMERLGKLAYYVGELKTPEDNSGRRLDIFDTCADQAETIADTKSAQYYYWRATCLALKAKSANIFKRLAIVGPLKSALNEGLALASPYEGGGIYRVAAAVYIKSSGKIFGLYQPEKALEMIDKAIQIGPEHYNAYLVKADVLGALNRPKEAKLVLQEASARLAKLQKNQFPAGIEAETVEYQKRINARL